MGVKNLVVLAVLLLAQSRGWAQYNEMYDENGQLRPQYQGVMKVLSKVTPEQEKDYEKRSNEAFRKDNSLALVPRVILGSEYDQQLVAGFDQRARALRAFLKDYFSGGKKYTQVLPEAVLKRIVERNNDSKYLGRVNPNDIQFPYGPDIMKDSSGKWRVIEDNPGMIGGPGDLELAQNFLFENQPDLMDHVNARDPNDYFKRLTDYYKAKAWMNGGKAVFLMSKFQTDNEDSRLVKMFEKFGIQTVYVAGRTQLEISKNAGGGVYTYDNKQGKRDKKTGRSRMEKVGYIILNGEHHWFDLADPGTWDRVVGNRVKELLEDEDLNPGTMKILRALLRDPSLVGNPDGIYEALKRLRLQGPLDELRSSTPYDGLTQKIISGEVSTNYTPGLDFIGDKEFYSYVPGLISAFLNEAPILENIETQRFASDQGSTANENVVQEVLKNKDEFVVKRVDGRGGDGVAIGKKKTKAEMNKLMTQVRSEPESFIAQKYMHLSVHNGRIVDIRTVGQVGTDENVIANVPWGRGLPLNGNGKVNLSGDGIEITVLIHDEINSKKLRCESLMIH